MTYEKFLGVIESAPGTSSTQKTAIGKARPLAKAADAIKAKQYGGATDEEKKANALIKQKDLDKALEDLRKETVNIFGSDIPDSSQPIKAVAYSGGPATMGHEMEVKPLTFKLKEKGSAPSTASHRVYDDINLRKHSAGSTSFFYVRGHLLNQRLGGKGQWLNMTPLSISGNAQHEGQIEAIVKRAVESGAVVHYHVNVNYGARGDKQSLKTAITNTDPNPAHVPIKHKIIDAEDYVPTSLTANAFVIKKETDGKYVPVTTLLSGKKIDNEIKRNAGDYHVTGSIPAVPVNLNAMHFQEYIPLRRHTGFTTVMGMVLVGNLMSRKRPYRTYAEFKADNKQIPAAVLERIEHDDDDAKLLGYGVRINKFPS
jgi:hypothetical protein